MTPQRIYELARKLKAARTLSEKLGLLGSTSQTFDRPQHDRIQRWDAARRSGLLELLLTDLSADSSDTVSLFIYSYLKW